ncbi:MAG: zf-TFIIB domain-containing protein [Anaerolineae bacterium]|nr:hypothetical protein [Chloroflexota bacterium]MCO6445874.1 zf-TFIIB domain-containing protein [Anaerolineae bacterium]MDL1917047.1 hypothetical protein [Anaerolineae bacterium CFX4]NOG50966.1 hypothetical protein [Chloroflexota bacterium]GIK27084.1 MAG: hypothetical protein BroJett007_02220 [Chloroflexota bacterium]
MKCPVDGTTLVISDRAGIEIDYCPTCRGVWLDRGELDKLIEREAKLYGAVDFDSDPRHVTRPKAKRDDLDLSANVGDPSRPVRHFDDDNDDDDDRRPYRRRKSFLSEIFDMLD